MNRKSIVEHVRARDRVIVWTATDRDRYWVYHPGKDRVDYVRAVDVVSRSIWVRGLAGIAALFPFFGESTHYDCRHCGDFHNTDDTAEWMLLAKLDRALTQAEFNGLAFRLTHPTRQNESSNEPLVMTEEERSRWTKLRRGTSR